MNHTLANLEAIVNIHNHAALNELWQRKKWMFPPSAAAPPFNTAPHPHTGASVKSHAFARPKITIGKFNSKVTPFDLWDFVQDALVCRATTTTEAVFSVIDDSSSGSNVALDVVLCVGINYWQFTSFRRPMLVTNTGMRTNLMSSFKLANQSAANSCRLPDHFHMVAANFFPWITSVRWETIIRNGIGESILMNTCGYDDPVRVIADLVDGIEPKWIVFHGTNNCVPILGMRVLQASKHKNAISVLCDNLGQFPGCNSILFP